MTKTPPDLEVGQLKQFLQELYVILSVGSGYCHLLRLDKHRRPTMPTGYLSNDFFLTNPEEWTE